MRFAPTSTSRLNRVGRHFRDISVNRLCRGVFIGVPALAAAIDEYIAHHATKPELLIGVKRVADILQKVIRAKPRLSFKQNATRHWPVRKTCRRRRTRA